MSETQDSETSAERIAKLHALTAALSEARLPSDVAGSSPDVGVPSHDLRDPLGAISTAASLLSLREERIARPLNRILRSANRMGRMISQLLDFTRIRLGAGIPLERKRVDLVEHGGSIRVNSDPDRTAFVVELPRREAGQVLSPAGESP